MSFTDSNKDSLETVVADAPSIRELEKRYGVIIQTDGDFLYKPLTIVKDNLKRNGAVAVGAAAGSFFGFVGTLVGAALGYVANEVYEFKKNKKMKEEIATVGSSRRRRGF